MEDIKEPFVIMLIGPTLSGKSTYIRNFYPDIDTISRDEIVMEVFGSRDYNRAFKEVDQKEVDRLLAKRLREANDLKKSVIIDMTNMTVKRRMATLRNFDEGFSRIAIVFPILPGEEYARRNNERNAKENKWIPPFVIKSMIESYQEPSAEEGYDKITIL
jgi:predicted kinase